MHNWEKNVCITHMQGNTSWCGWICILHASTWWNYLWTGIDAIGCSWRPDKMLMATRPGYWALPLTPSVLHPPTDAWWKEWLLSLQCQYHCVYSLVYRVAPPLFCSPQLLPYVNGFSKLFRYQNQEKICNNTITKDPTTPKCIATLTCEMSGVLKATIENKTTSITTHFKKLTTGNSMLIVSVIV